MIAGFVEENHDNWDRFLHEFSFALRTAVNETTGKTPAELFLGRKIITPFCKLVLVTDGAEYAGGNIEKLFDQARQNIQRQHKTWEKYYNRISGTGLELVKRQATVRYLYHSATAAISGNKNKSCKSKKGNAGLEDLRVKRTRPVVSTGTSERYDKKRPKYAGSDLTMKLIKEKRQYCHSG
ncbi:uncharacterized protein TNCV_5115451 [Trichonephila clavipes]|nr:uncharacterized protein TNCV_5115451 [Trichonephila clavipes]